MCCYLTELLLLLLLLLLMFIATSAATCYCFIVQLSPRYCHYYVLLLLCYYRCYYRCYCRCYYGV